MAIIIGRPEQLFKELQKTAAIRGLIGQPENTHFDCKEWPTNDDDAQRMLAKAACGLTNSEGGVLVIGMRAKAKSKDEPDVVESAAPVGDTSAVKSRVLNLIGNLVEPGIAGIDAAEVHEQENLSSGFVVVYVPMSEGPPDVQEKTGNFTSASVLGPSQWSIFKSRKDSGKDPIRGLNSIWNWKVSKLVLIMHAFLPVILYLVSSTLEAEWQSSRASDSNVPADSPLTNSESTAAMASVSRRTHRKADGRPFVAAWIR
jgi:hypothetical protein